MDYKQAMRELKSGKVRSVYICYGAEVDLQREFVERVQAQIIARENRDFAVSRYDLRETPVEVVLEDAETPPFIAERKLVIAHDASFLTSKNKSRVEHDTERLAAYVESPAAFTVIVFTVAADKLDERKKIVKHLKRNKALYSFQTPSIGEMTQWIQHKAKQQACTIEEDAVETLFMLCGTNRSMIASEIEKLTLLAGQGGNISAEMVKAIVARTSEQTVFMLVDEAANMNADKLFDMLSELLKQREEPIKIAAMLTRQFRIILQVKELQRNGMSEREMSSQLGLHPFAVKIARRQSARFSADRLAAIMTELAELDYAMKSGWMDKVLALELFLLKLVARPRSSLGTS